MRAGRCEIERGRVDFREEREGWDAMRNREREGRGDFREESEGGSMRNREGEGRL